MPNIMFIFEILTLVQNMKTDSNKITIFSKKIFQSTSKQPRNSDPYDFLKSLVWMAETI